MLITTNVNYYKKTFYEENTMSYTHLTIKQRIQIETLHAEKYSARSISKIIGVHHSTVSREINRCKDAYDADTADKDYQSKSAAKGRKTKATEEFVSIITEKLQQNWSPEQIVGRLFKGTLCVRTIYNWIISSTINFSVERLRHKGKRLKSEETRGKFHIGKSISDRPNEVKSREEFGHWELDTIVSSRGKSKGCIATLVERKTRYCIALKMPDRSAGSMLAALKSAIRAFPAFAFKTFTSDRGKEFACFVDIEKHGIDFYCADAYSAWQRGTNENTNGLLRQYFPKRTDLAQVTDFELYNVLVELNNRPRKCLDFMTPSEKFQAELDLVI